MMSKRALVLGGVALVAAAGFTTIALAQDPADAQELELRDQGRQARAQGQPGHEPDGSWREEVRQGNCVTVKEMSAAGEYKETRQCNPALSRQPPRR